jgi:hypothetical protein
MVVSPGPAVYEQKSTLGSDLPSYSFGPGDEIDVKTKGGPKNGAAQALASKSRPPGPGAYNQKSSIGGQAVSTKITAPKCRFGTAERSKYGKQYSGLQNITMEHSESPGFMYLTEDEEAKADKKQASAFTEQSDSKKKSAPSFSFGRKSNVQIRRPRSREEMGHVRARASTAPTKKKPAKDNYDWLYPARANRKMKSDYEKRLDGCDMPKAKNFNRAATFGFGSDRRFNEAEFLPQNAIGRPMSPGPVYILPPTIGDPGLTYTGNTRSAPCFSFPNNTNRSNPDIIRAVKEQYPGPGAHNTLIEQRIDSEIQMERELEAEEIAAEEEALLQDEEDAIIAAGGIPPPRDPSYLSSLKVKAMDPFLVSQRSGRGGSMHARQSHLKYGVDPTKKTGPTFGFGTGNRIGRAKQYTPGGLNKDQEGRDSPGPNSRFRQEGRDGPGDKERWGSEVIPGTPYYSFGGAGVERNQIAVAANQNGPASIGATELFGTQSLSKNTTVPQFKIGTSTRDKESSRYTPGKLNGGFARETPGPKYTFEESLNYQSSSRRRNAPVFGFGTSKRQPPGKKNDDTPGPGAYGGGYNQMAGVV